MSAAFVELLDERRTTIAERTGIDVTIGAIAVRSIDTYRNTVAGPERLTDDPTSMVENPDIDLVVELIEASSLPAP